MLQVLGPDQPGEIACEPEALARAARMGAELVEAVRSTPA